MVLFMAANSLLAGATQILCVIAFRGAKGANSTHVAKSLKTNPVFVRRILKDLAGHGLVEMRPGRHGGVALLRAPDDITLEDIHRAVGGGAGLFAQRSHGNPRCVVNEAMKTLLPPVFAAANDAVEASLRQTKLSELIGKID